MIIEYDWRTRCTDISILLFYMPNAAILVNHNLFFCLLFNNNHLVIWHWALTMHVCVCVHIYLCYINMW